MASQGSKVELPLDDSSPPSQRDRLSAVLYVEKDRHAPAGHIRFDVIVESTYDDWRTLVDSDFRIMHVVGAFQHTPEILPSYDKARCVLSIPCCDAPMSRSGWLSWDGRLSLRERCPPLWRIFCAKWKSMP